MANTAELSDSTWLAIQCDDRTFHVTYGTVNKCPNGLLAIMASQRWNETKETTFRIETNANMMEWVVQWLRTQVLPSTEYVDRYVLRATADFLNLEPMVQALDQVSEQEQLMKGEIYACLSFTDNMDTDRFGRRTPYIDYRIDFILESMGSMDTYEYGYKEQPQDKLISIKSDVPKAWLVQDRFPLMGFIEKFSRFPTKEDFFTFLVKHHWVRDPSRQFSDNQITLRYSMADAMRTQPVYNFNIPQAGALSEDHHGNFKDM